MISAFALFFATVMFADLGPSVVRANNVGITLNIGFRQNYSSEQGRVEYSTDNKSTWIPVTSAINTSVTLSNGVNNLYIRVVCASGYSMNPLGMSYREGAENPRPLNDSANASIVSALTGDGYPVTTGATAVELMNIEFSAQGGNQPGPGGGGNFSGAGKYRVNIVVNQDCGNFTPNITLGFSGGNQQHSSSTDSEQDIPAGSTSVSVYFAPDSNERENLKNFRVEEFNASGERTGREWDGFDAIRDDSVNNTWTKEIDPSNYSYEFRFEFSRTRNVSWSYDASAPEDQFVEHCRIYKLTGDDPSTAQEGTDFNLTIGEDFYFLLVPDYGYQVNGLLVNGWIPIEPMNHCGVFKFSMVDSNFHFNAMVTPTDDITDASGASAVSGVSVGNGENATANGGNLRVTVTDATTPSGVSGVTSGEVLSTVDIDVDNIVSKGDGSYWSSDVTDISSPLTMGLTLEGASAGTYAVVREHEGVLTQVEATYDASTGMLTFPSDQFSTFTIVRTGNAVETATAAGNTLQAVANKPYETGKLYADHAVTPASDALHPAKGVKIKGITEITNKDALAALAEEVNNLYLLTQKVGINSSKTYAMDLQASGSGKVTFDVGVTGTAAAVISHFHGGKWTRQIADVADGQVTGYFNDFSPVYITVYEGTTANELRKAGVTETEFQVTSPKTGQETWPVILVALFGCLSGFMVARFRRK